MSLSPLSPRSTVTVIQHEDSLPPKEVIKSTSIKVRVYIDGKHEEIILLLDKEIPVYQTIDSGTLTLKDYKTLRKLFKKELEKDYPEKSNEEIEKIAEDIVFTIHSTRRRYVNIFRGKDGLYRQIKTHGR